MLSLRTQSLIIALFALILALQNFLLSSKLPGATDGHTLAPAAGVDPRAIGLILPDGTVTFTPEEFRAGRPQKYVNLPNVPVDPGRDAEVRRLAERPVPPPAETLLHEAPAPPGPNAILGLASYPEFMDGWRKLVGSLRINGYDGHIIMGVNPAIPTDERDYLDRMGVTYYAVEASNCLAAILDGSSDTDNTVRAKCSRGMEDLKLEWGRYEMARRWLRACGTCTGWSMVIDTRDIFFQADPFASLGSPGAASHDLLFVEELAKYTSTLPKSRHRATNLGESWRYRVHVHPCYGKESVRAYELVDRPILCSGTVIGTRDGMHRFLSVLVDQFRRNNGRGPRCRSPATTDQWTMNYLYYHGGFGFEKPCVNAVPDYYYGQQHSQTDMVFMDDSGAIVNPHEKERSATRVAPTLHQWDRCYNWIFPWFNEHKHMFMSTEEPEDEPAMAWVK
ncbi:hypothetical protein ACHAWF_010040 [Thalassiosira exigua]